MKAPDILEVTLKVVSALEQPKIRYFIGGSLASSAFGVPRSTIDVDIVAVMRPDQATAVESLLKGEFYVDVDPGQLEIDDAKKRLAGLNG